MITLLTQQDIASRWQVSVQSVETCRKEGVITPVKGVPGIRFSLAEIEALEGVELTRFSPLERKKFQRELELLKKENDLLKQITGNILSEASKIISLGKVI